MDFKNLPFGRFRSSLYTRSDYGDKLNVISLASFLENCKVALDKTAPKNQKYIIANNGPLLRKLEKLLRKGLH